MNLTMVILYYLDDQYLNENKSWIQDDFTNYFTTHDEPKAGIVFVSDVLEIE